MKLFQTISKNKRLKNNQFGISENHQYRCLVGQFEQMPQVIWQNIKEPFEIGVQQLLAGSECFPSSESEEVSKFTRKFVNKTKQKFTLIRAISHHYIWRKRVLLPLVDNKQLIYKQVIQILEQELPLPIEQVYFDFKIKQQTEKQLTQITLFALRKAFADPLLSECPTILDNELHCYWRGFHYLFPKLENHFLKIDSLNFQFNSNGLTISEEDNGIDITTLDFPEKILSPYLYLSALGASLWNGTE
ncbi:hypothetical protein A1D29_09900 [Pasteurellaceae bacterium Orientalotternb1]|nr:hypothetical protein A1D29_09900 [Pasteurellaceae bacterium Orientalotternb1]